MDAERVAQAEKIRKILSRASSPFEGEAKLAASRAWELIGKYGLEYPVDLVPQTNNGRWTPREHFVGAFKAAERIWRSLGYSFREYVPDSDRPNETYRDTTNQSYHKQRARRTDFYTGTDGVSYGHKNRYTQEEYKGKNQQILEEARLAHGWSSTEWVGFRQAVDHGGNLRGQHGTRIEKWFPILDRVTGEPTGRMGHKILTVFNTDQITWA
jgi:hypothetical protein